MRWTDWFPHGDGCTWWPDFWRGIDLRPCCAAHDEMMATTFTTPEWVVGTWNFIQCGINAGAVDWTIPAGVVLFLVSWPIHRWGDKMKERIKTGGTYAKSRI